MKVVINVCFGGYSISNKAVAMLAKLNGKKAYFFKHDFKTRTYTPVKQPSGSLFTTAFSVKNPNEILESKDWSDMSADERIAFNAKFSEIELTHRPENRSDPLLIKVIEKLGKEANGECAELRIVEIPDGTDFEISEYDGNEHIAEKHQTWR